MRRNRLLLPWGLLAGLLIAFAAVEGLNIKPPSLRTKTRGSPTTPRATPLTTTSTTTTTTTEAPETTTELEHENDTLADGDAPGNKSLLSGIPQIDYVHDPNLPRELPKGYNLSDYPFFERVPDNVEYDCTGKLDGFYANVEYKCQIYHHCVTSLRYDFLCPNYTAFDQRTFNCHFVSEVDCANSAKWWFRNEPLYKGRKTTSTTTTTTTPVPTTSTRRPAGGRRRRPYRRRRPQYDYYDDEEYDDEEYDDDLDAQTKDRQRSRQRRPTAAPPASADADAPLKPIGASVYRPRVLPKIRRPVPINEREKYEYKSKDGAPAPASAERRPSESPEKPSVPAPNTEPEKPKRPADTPAPPAEKPRSQKASPQEEDEYYDDEDYDQPVRTTSRKNHHDYYAPSGGDRDFTRRPAMSGAGRPVRRNHPDRRRPALVEYDDDYEDDRRPYRPAQGNGRRRPNKSRKRPYQRDDDYYDDDEYERPSYRETKRPQASRDAYERPSAPARGSAYDRPAQSRDSAPRTPPRESATYDRAPPSSRDTTYSRPATPPRDSGYERPVTSSRDSTYDRPETSSRDSTYERPARPAPSTRESTYERNPPPARDTAYERPASRDSAFERSPSPSRDRQAAVSRDADYYRDAPHDEVEYSRPASKEYDRAPVSKKRTQTTPTRDSTYERPRQERPSSRGSPDYESNSSPRPLPSRTRPAEDESEQPIPAARPAYISPYRKRGPEEAAPASGLRGVSRPSPQVTTPPPLPDDEEYYDDEEELEPEDELPQRPTGSGRTQTGSYRDPQVEARKPSTGRGEEGADTTAEEKERARPASKDRERTAPAIPPTGRGRFTPAADDTKTRTRLGYADEDNSESRSETRVSGSKTPHSHEQTRSNTNRGPESILEQPPLRATQGSLRAKEESVEESVPQREGFRPSGSAEVTTDRYSNFRRKGAQGGGAEAKKAPPLREDRIVEVAEDVHIAPSFQGRSQVTDEESHRQVDVELESESSQEDSSKQLDTSKLISSAETEDRKPVPLSGPTGQGFNNRKPQKAEDDDPVPTGRGVHKSPEFLDDPPHRNELPDINDPEYDVTLNEALQPTRPILLSTEGAVGKKTKLPFRDGGIEPELKTLLTSASHTHVSKAPFPTHGKDALGRRPSTARPKPQYDDYDDPPIPTGRGGTTESVFRASPVSVASRGASGGGVQYVQFATSPATGTLRQLEQELSKAPPRPRVNPLPYRSPSQGTIREADFYRGTIDPISLSLGYDVNYEQAAKYRPRRKLVWRDRYHDFYNLY